MRIPLVDLQAQYHALHAQIDAAIHHCLDSTHYVLGPQVTAFEEEFAAYCGTQYAVGVNSGTDALHLSLRALGISPGDEVITAAYTFIATVEAILYTGARPVLVDIEPRTYCIDPAAVARAITPKTKAIIVVHVYGHPADMDPILALARRHGLFVIEDACQAHGARYKGRRVGSIGDLGCFSFYPSKNLGGIGDGGMVVTHDHDLAAQLRKLRHHGHASKYEHALVGYNSRLDSIQAAVLLAKLPHLDSFNEHRRQAARIYDELLAPTDVITPYASTEVEHVFNLYTIRLRGRDSLMEILEQEGIGCNAHYRRPCHLQRACRALGYGLGSLPHTEHAATEVVQLPMYPELTPGQVEAVCKVVRAFTEAYIPSAQSVAAG